MPRAEEAVVRRMIDEVQRGHDLDAIDDLVSEDFVDLTAREGEPPGPDAVRANYRLLLDAFPDLDVVVHEMISVDDVVVTHKTLSGTHRGPFSGVPPTGRRVEIPVIDVVRVRNGRICSHRAVIDTGAILRAGDPSRPDVGRNAVDDDAGRPARPAGGRPPEEDGP